MRWPRGAVTPPGSKRLRKMGSTGDPPVPLGDSPSGRSKRPLSKHLSLLATRSLPVPPGESPGGTGQWPVLPKNGFPVTLSGDIANASKLFHFICHANKNQNGLRPLWLKTVSPPPSKIKPLTRSFFPTQILRACFKNPRERRVRARGLQETRRFWSHCRPGPLTGRFLNQALSEGTGSATVPVAPIGVVCVYRDGRDGAPRRPRPRGCGRNERPSDTGARGSCAAAPGADIAARCPCQAN